MTKNIMVVDDLADDREALVHMINHLTDYRASEATSGDEAIRMVQTGHVDLILMDMQMPYMEGWRVVSLLKQMEEARDTPVIAVTNYDGAVGGLRSMALEAGCADYMTKPLKVDDFVALLDKHLEA